MKILYAVQATGNGHISRAMELLPFLKNYGQVDLFLSGSNSTLALDVPVKFRSKGISLFYKCDGSLSLQKMLTKINPIEVYRMSRELPVEKYDLILNDFEAITALACRHKRVPSVQFGHQASFQSPFTPRPEKINPLGEWILKNYARASGYMGLHFECYDNNIFSPVIKSTIRNAVATNQGYIAVYLPAYCKPQLLQCFRRFSHVYFHIFSHETNKRYRTENIEWIPVSSKDFNQSLLHCEGIITGGGFETPAEALYLGKKIIAIPIKGQYEQECNAAALKRLDVPVLEKLNDLTPEIFVKWMNEKNVRQIKYLHTTEQIIDALMQRHVKKENMLDITYPEYVFD